MGRGIRGLREVETGTDAGGAKPEASAASRCGNGESGGIESILSSCSSWAGGGGGDVALGGSSLRELPPPGDAADEAGRPVALLLWETRAVPESSLSESTSSTLFPLLGRAGAGVDAMANGTATMGGGEADGGGVGREATVGTSEAAASPPSLADFVFFKNLARASRLEEVITEPAAEKNSRAKINSDKAEGEFYSQTRADNHKGSSKQVNPYNHNS